MLKLGDRGYKVKELQEWLISIGYLDVIEENYGINTKIAIRELQKDLSYEVTGIYTDDLLHLYNLREIYTRDIRDTKNKVNSYKSDLVSTSSRTVQKRNPKSIIVDSIPCYIINLNTSTKIEFNLTPEEISESNSTSIDEQVPKGRSSPIIGYTSTGPNELSFTISLCDDYLDESIDVVVRKLKALIFPLYNTMIYTPKALVRIGSFINFTGVPTSVDVTWKKPYRNGLYIYADVSLAFTEVTDKALDSKDIEGGKS